MLKRGLGLALLTCLASATLWAATDSFVGDWKLNPSKSKLIDKMKVESLGGNKYEFDFGGGPEEVVVDGTDQPAIYGTMLSVTSEGPSAWKVVRKKDGKILLMAEWKLAQDGNALSDVYTEFGPNGSPSTVNYQYQRTGPGSGFAGTWETLMPIGSAFVLQVRPYEENGLSFSQLPEGATRNVTFDGKDYPEAGRHVVEGSMQSARRVDEHRLEIIHKVNGKTTRSEQIELSSDLKTLTRTVRPVGQREANVFVFDRQ